MIDTQNLTAHLEKSAQAGTPTVTLIVGDTDGSAAQVLRALGYLVDLTHDNQTQRLHNKPATHS